MNEKSPIGIFDSGLGGLSVMASIQELMPFENIIFYGDSANNPYGTKTRKEICDLSETICDWFMEQDVKAIVIACNTATSAAAPLLRKKYPIDIVGMEPALKVAASKAGHQRIAVWATDFTLKEEKFARLMARFEKEHAISKIPCPKLVQLVETDSLDKQELVDEVLKDYLEQSGWQNLDSIVLGCTHFVFFKKRLEELTEGRVEIIDGNEGTARHLKALLGQRNLLNHEGGCMILTNSREDRIDLSRKLLNKVKE